MRPVRVLVHLNNLALGGAQLNAVDIARTLRERGHDPVLFAQGVSPILSSSQSRRHGQAWRDGAPVSLPCFRRR